MTTLQNRDFVRAAQIAAVLLGTAALWALAVRLVAPAAAREWLSFPFIGIPRRLGEVVAIVLNNLRLLGGLLGAAGLAQLSLRTRARGLATMVWACDAIVLISCLNHVVVVGAAVGAYAGKGLGAVLPHGPLELASYSVALSLYVAARQEPVALRRATTLAVISAAGLLVAAIVEVML